MKLLSSLLLVPSLSAVIAIPAAAQAAGSRLARREIPLVPADLAAQDNFGHAVSIWGDTLVVSSRLDDDMGGASGSAYVYVRSGTSWIETTKLAASDSGTNYGFGYAVDIHDGTTVVGSNLHFAAGTQSGKAFVYTRPALQPKGS